MHLAQCLLCGQQLQPAGVIERIRSALPGVEIPPNVAPTDLEEHMAFQHGFSKAYKRNVSEGIAEAYYRVVDKPIEINGRTFNFGDYVEFENGQLVIHAPGGIYPDNDMVKLERRFEGFIGDTVNTDITEVYEMASSQPNEEGNASIPLTDEVIIKDELEVGGTAKPQIDDVIPSGEIDSGETTEPAEDDKTE